MATTTRTKTDEPPKPPPPPSTWQVAAGSRTLTVTAIHAAISVNGIVVFKDAEGQLIKAFANNHWASVEMVGDPFGNTVEPT